MGERDGRQRARESERESESESERERGSSPNQPTQLYRKLGQGE